MAKTYRITIEYTTTEDMSSGPDYWDWPELLDLDIARETFGVWVDKVETNQDHVREIRATNQEMLNA
ncbi:hypothetical protein EBT31_09610 [bacterium]|jgi:hypothetical protein|nr:hypothetical protein [bacterium]